KDDSHADDIVRICREVFDKGNDFCKKITYKTTGESAKSLLQKFRNSYFPRIAVTVDMIATGTDIKPLEIVFFMRSVRSRNFFDQMKGRGVRVISETEMEQVNPGVKRKTRFIVVDAVGVCERVKTDTRPLERKLTVSFEKLLDAVGLGTTEAAVLESLAGRLIRLERRLDDEIKAEVEKSAKGLTLSKIARELLDAVDPDRIEAAARAGLPSSADPTDRELKTAAEALTRKASIPLAANPDLRNLLKKIQKAAEQTIDVISRDALLYAGPTQQSTQNAAQLVTSFREFIQKHQAEIAALQILYSRPYRLRLTEPLLKELEKKLRAENAAWNEEALWRAFAAAQPGKVKGRSVADRFADLVPLVRFALEQQPVLEPFTDSVHRRFDDWLAQKSAAGASFTPDQRAWLELIRDHIATSLSIEPGDFDYAPFNQRGGLGRAHQLFGEQLPQLLDELNEVLAA
ncbi:MAG: restriction endonuclease subunit R, partial [Proteobacteria bacterium]|nr:restriction endonuclease subunit R [Pseudomonadota bacterium]